MALFILSLITGEAGPRLAPGWEGMAGRPAGHARRGSAPGGGATKFLRRLRAARGGAVPRGPAGPGRAGPSWVEAGEAPRPCDPRGRSRLLTCPRGGVPGAVAAAPPGPASPPRCH